MYVMANSSVTVVRCLIPKLSVIESGGDTLAGPDGIARSCPFCKPWSRDCLKAGLRFGKGMPVGPG